MKWEEPRARFEGSAPPDGERIKQAAALFDRLRKIKGVEAAFISNRTRATELLEPHAAVGYARVYSVEDIQKYADLGAGIWFYNSGRDRHSPGFFSWKFSRYGARGTVEWGGFWRADAVMQRSEETLAYYRDGERAGECGKLVPSIFWEQIREGVEDQRYALTLEKLVAGRPAGPLATSGRALLDEIDKAVGAHPFSMPPGWGGDAYERRRRRIVEAILRLGND